ncbi:hypothetical protein HDU81_002135 [Chytriomyces hyalinus]|nr:hypothetical protein HDU81_002135 [Chytriomyces hyalinus]
MNENEQEPVPCQDASKMRPSVTSNYSTASNFRGRKASSHGSTTSKKSGFPSTERTPTLLHPIQQYGASEESFNNASEVSQLRMSVRIMEEEQQNDVEEQDEQEEEDDDDDRFHIKRRMQQLSTPHQKSNRNLTRRTSSDLHLYPNNLRSSQLSRSFNNKRFEDEPDLKAAVHDSGGDDAESIQSVKTRKSLFQWLLWASESTRFQIYFFSILHMVILLTITITARFVIGQQIPSILIYNLIHAGKFAPPPNSSRSKDQRFSHRASFQVTGLMGKISIAMGLRATQLISKEFISRDLIRRGKGVSLTSISVPIPFLKLNADEGRTLRYIFIASLMLLEGNLWLLGIQMEWRETVSDLGQFACTPLQFSQPPTFRDDLGVFLQGSFELSRLYSFGLPLEDGIVGGMAAWPLYTPMTNFIVTHPGIGFAVNSVCGNLHLAPQQSNNRYTQFTLTDITAWKSLFSVTIQVQLPAGSHDWIEYANSDILQDCMLRFMMGDADVGVSFISDGWGGIVPDALDHILINGEGNLVGPLRLEQLHPESTNDKYFGNVHDAFGKHNVKLDNLTHWVLQGVKEVLGNRTYAASSVSLTGDNSAKRTLYADLLQWATLQDGQYHTNHTWKGLAAIVAATAKFVLLQHDKTPRTQCMYSGMNGAGFIEAHAYVITLTMVTVGICFVCELAQLFWWFLLSGGGEMNDRAARMLRNPRQMVYDLRKCGTELLETWVNGVGNGPAAIARHYKQVFVRFGELRQTRSDSKGMLVLGAPKDVLAVNDERRYY